MLSGMPPAFGSAGTMAMRRRKQDPPGGWFCGEGDGRHGVAVLTPALGGGGARGAPWRSKVSTMIMRPPQQGHSGGCSATAPLVSASLCSAAVSIDGSGVAAINFLARAMLALQAAVASSP